MTGADNPDSLYKPSPVFEKWRKEEEKRKRYGNHNYRFKKESPEQSAQNILKNIKACKELDHLKLLGFIGGISKGKCPTVLGDSLKFLHKDLEKQILDYNIALTQGTPLKQDLVNLINVAECLFVKLDHLEKRKKKCS